MHEQKSAKRLKLWNSKITRLNSTQTLVTVDTDTDVSLIDHRHIISPVPHG